VAALAAWRMEMTRRSERGEGRLGSLILLVLLVAVGLAAWNLIPVYWEHYDFKDKVNEICRQPRYKARNDQEVMNMLMKEVTERRLTPWINQQSFDISTTETSRQIHVHYERPVEILPGFKRTLIFDYTADQPLI
jgi:hypothetical protein